MVAMVAVVALLLVLLVSEPALAGRPHISNLNVLLPPRTIHPVRFRLQGWDGCFSWTWDHHDIISLEAEYNGTLNDCSTSAVITPLATFDERQATAVHATDILTGEVLRCEVFVDRISRIQIFHHSVKLDLDGWATLRIRAFDAEDNVFSTLVGLRFIWQLSPVSGNSLPHRLLNVPLKDTPLSDCGCMCGEYDTQVQLEESGFGSDLYVVRGVSAGQEKVKARLLEPKMEDLEDTLTLTVAEAISLEPHSPLYIIPGTRFQFRLRSMRKNILTVIPLPSPQHQWFVTNTSVASVDRYNGFVVGKNLGVTSAVVEDIRVKGHQQMASVYVVTPTSLRLYLSPVSAKGVNPRVPLDLNAELLGVAWHLVVGREYVVHVLAFSLESGTRPLYLTQSNDLRLFFTYLPYWEAIEVPEDLASEHGWQNATLIRAMAAGNGTLAAKLTYEDDAGTKVLRVEQGVKVCSPVSIVLEESGSSRMVFLPWSPGSSQEYRLKAEGGCGDKPTDYFWSSSSPIVAIVNAFGMVQSRGPGKTVIRVSSVKDSLNADEIQVEVSVPSSIAPIEGLPVDVEVNTNLPVAVSLTTPAGHSYSRCDAYNLLVQWDLFGGDGNFKLVEPSGLADIAKFFAKGGWESSSLPLVMCAWNMLLPLRPGKATVTASLKVSSAETPAFLEASWMVASYAPLALEQVSDGNFCGGYGCNVAPSRESVGQNACQDLKELLLVVGSGMKVMLKGGPERWRQGPHFVEHHNVMSDDTGDEAPDEVAVVRTVDGGGRIFSISCSGFGNYTLVFRRGYQENEEPVNIVASTSLSVVCNAPNSVVLIIDEPDNSLSSIKSAAQLERDRDRNRLAPITVVNGRSIRVAAVALHNSGKPFANASSLALSWDLSDCHGLAYWEDLASYEDSWERILGLRNSVGLCIVRATITHLKQANLPASSLATASKFLKQAKPFLSDAAQLQLVAALILDPKEILLFCHLDAKATLRVIGGTNDIESNVNDSRVAIVIQPPLGTRISHLVVAARAMGTASVSIRDVGLATPASASALVHVADIAWIRLLPDDASLQLGTMMEVQLQAGDSSGRNFDPSQFALFNIHVHLQDEVIELVNESSSKILGNIFTIRSANLGLTTFYVTVQQASGRELHSDFGKIEVYAPLYIHPSSLVLAPGAQFMVCDFGISSWELMVHGGPRTGVFLEYSSSDPMVATVDGNSGLVIARSVGNEVIFAKARNHDGLLLGQVSTGISVSIPVSMSLEIRGGQLGVGREMSIFPLANEGNLFTFCEMCTNYKWSITNEEVLRLYSVEPVPAEQVTETLSSEGNDNEGSASTWLVDAGFSARVIGRSPGRATVTVNFVCHFHVLGGHSVPKHYSASDTISVVPDPPLALGMCATWVLPPEYRSSKLLPQQTSDRISSSSQTVTYSVMHDGGSSQDVLSIEGGHIRTADRTEVGCIHSRDRSTGRSEVAVCIRVAEVAQMTVGDNDFPFHVAELSVGTQQSFMVTLRDNIGSPFFEVNLETLPLSIDTNRADVVSLKATNTKPSGASSNVTVVVQALRQGKALIRISQKNKLDVADYILVLVGAYIYPRNPVMHIGDRVNFSVVGKGLHAAVLPSLERGQWSSGDENVVRVNSRTGEAEGIAEGGTTVSFNGSRLTTYTSVSVVRVSSVILEAPKLQFFTNVPFPDQGYRFPVRFRDTHGRNVGIVGENRAISYDCKVHPDFVGRAAPLHEQIGSFYCIFFPYTPEKIAFNLHRELKSKRVVTEMGDSKGLLRMKVTAVLVRTPDVSGVAEATFAGGFSVIERPPQLQLSPKSNRSRIAIVGSVGGIAISWHRKDAVNVKVLTNTEELGLGGHAVYEVNLLEEEKSFADKLVFLLTTTGQREEIPLWYDAGDYVAAVSQQIFTVAAITLILIVLPLFWCTRLLDLPRPFRMAPVDRSSPMVAQVFHDGAADGVLVNGNIDSVHTPLQFRAFSRTPPQPYTEYVSRTIEQTPYFSRQGNRRPDPSRTY